VYDVGRRVLGVGPGHNLHVGLKEGLHLEVEDVVVMHLHHHLVVRWTTTL